MVYIMIFGVLTDAMYSGVLSEVPAEISDAHCSESLLEWALMFSFRFFGAGVSKIVIAR